MNILKERFTQKFELLLLLSDLGFFLLKWVNFGNLLLKLNFLCFVFIAHCSQIFVVSWCLQKAGFLLYLQGNRDRFIKHWFFSWCARWLLVVEWEFSGAASRVETSHSVNL